MHDQVVSRGMDVNPTRRNVVGDRHEMDAESNNGLDANAMRVICVARCAVVDECKCNDDGAGCRVLKAICMNWKGMCVRGRGVSF